RMVRALSVVAIVLQQRFPSMSSAIGSIQVTPQSRSHDRKPRLKMPEYQTWLRIKKRCHNPLDKSYPQYGGRGIEVCQEWRESFQAFLRDMGPRPSPHHSIDRLDGTKGYSPDNCRWATKEEQA